MDILLTKDIQNSWIFQDSEKLKWWLDLVLMAEENGEIHMSLSDLFHRWNAPKTTVHRFLENLRVKPIYGTKVERLTEHLIIIKTDSYKGVRNSKWNESGTHTERPFPSLPLSPPTPPSITISSIPKDISTSSAPAYAHTREEEFVRRYQDEGLWAEVAMVLHVKSLEKCQSLFREFVVEYQHNGIAHQDYNDFKRHFIQWARVAIRKNNQDNGNNNRTTDTRRSAGVSSAEEISESF